MRSKPVEIERGTDQRGTILFMHVLLVERYRAGLATAEDGRRVGGCTIHAGDATLGASPDTLASRAGADKLVATES
jgi:hypothetical protein